MQGGCWVGLMGYVLAVYGVVGQGFLGCLHVDAYLLQVY